MKKRLVAIVLPALFCGSHLLGRDVADAPIGKDVEAEAESKWEFTISATTYVPLHDQDYVNPTIVADRDWLHLEARYNYEALKTGSLWLGCNWAPIKDFDLTITPMIGGVFGNSTGVAPGYNIMTEYRWIEFFTQGEYFIDAGTHENNFFYSWSELSVVPMKWFRAGLVVQRTKAIGTTIDVQRGPLLGLRYRNIDLSIYWLSPGNHSSTFVFALGTTF